MKKFPIIKIDSKGATESLKGSKKKYWLEVNKRIGLVKLNKYEIDSDSIKETRSWNISEKLFSEIALYLGYSCVETDFIVDENGLYGIVSYDYRKDNVLEISGDDIYLKSLGKLPQKVNKRYIDANYNYEDILKILIYYGEDYSLIIDFNKIMVMDALTGEMDRHYENWSIGCLNGKYSLFPMYDNSTCLLHQFRDKSILESKIRNNSIKDFAEKSVSKIRIEGIKYKHFEFIKYLLNELPKEPRKDLIFNIKNLNRLSDNIIEELINKIPNELCDNNHKNLIIEYIKTRRDFLLLLVEEL